MQSNEQGNLSPSQTNLNPPMSPSSFNFENGSKRAWHRHVVSEHGLEDGRRHQDSDLYKRAQKLLQDILDARTASLSSSIH